MTINHAVISGNLTRDCEERRTQSGMTIVSFTVAVNERRKNQSGEYDDYTNYIGCAVFGKYAEKMAPSLLKGTRVTVSGSLRYSQWEKDGQKRSKLEILAKEIEVPKPSQQGQLSQPSQPSNMGVPQFEEVSVYDSDIPF